MDTVHLESVSIQFIKYDFGHGPDFGWGRAPSIKRLSRGFAEVMGRQPPDCSEVSNVKLGQSITN